MALLCCQEHGIDQVLLDCNKENLGSTRTMQALGGKLQKECYDDNEHCVFQYYVIDVKKYLIFYN